MLSGMLGILGPERLTYDWKGQLAVLLGSCCNAGGSALPALACLQPVLDIRIAAWLIKPDSRDASDNPNVTAVRSPQPHLGDLSGTDVASFHAGEEDSNLCTREGQPHTYAGIP